jgi:CBS domain-containing protein
MHVVDGRRSRAARPPASSRNTPGAGTVAAMSKSIVGAFPVSALSADSVLRIDAAADLWSVASALAAAEVGILVVGDGDDVQGVVSERDVVRALAAHRRAGETTAADIAHRDVVWCDVNADVADVANEMMERYVRHVLVEEDGRLVGIVSARDLLGAYASGDFADPDNAD